MCLESLIEDIMSENVDRKKVIKILSDGIKSGSTECEICEEVYREVYDDLAPEYCKELVEDMTNGERTGAIWSIDETNNVAKKLDIDFSVKPYTSEEFWTVMNMEYYEHYIPLKKSGVTLEPSGWGRIADYALVKEPKKLINYYFCHC